MCVLIDFLKALSTVPDFVLLTIIKMADKIAATYHGVVTLKTFLIRFFPNFIYEWLPSNFVQVRRTITQMADKMAAAYQTQLSWSFLIGFLPIFIYGLLQSNSHSGSNMVSSNER